MTRRELLEERYEDALFSLLMDEVAISEGKKAMEEKERLNHDPEAQLPEGLDRRCEQTIRRGFARRTARTVGRFSVKSVKVLVIVAGLAAILFTGAFALSETVRVSTMNLVVEMCGGYAELNFGGAPSGPDAEMSLEVGWVPEGYVLEEQESNNASVWYIYQKSEGEYIRISYTKTDGLGMHVDTEDAEASELEVNGVKGTWIRSEDYQHLILDLNDQNAVIELIAEGMQEEDFLCVVNELRF